MSVGGKLVVLLIIISSILLSVSADDVKVDSDGNSYCDNIIIDMIIHTVVHEYIAQLFSGLKASYRSCVAM